MSGNPWNALLESLHSALIDELNERFPKEKPELGMPKRQTELAAPDEGVDDYVLVEIEQASQRGIALLGVALVGADKSLGGAESLWKAIFKRADAEFARRGIQPGALSLARGKGSPPALPKSVKPGRVIWVPFRVKNARVFLGLGV